MRDYRLVHPLRFELRALTVRLEDIAFRSDILVRKGKRTREFKDKDENNSGSCEENLSKAKKDHVKFSKKGLSHGQEGDGNRQEVNTDSTVTGSCQSKDDPPMCINADKDEREDSSVETSLNGSCQSKCLPGGPSDDMSNCINNKDDESMIDSYQLRDRSCGPLEGKSSNSFSVIDSCQSSASRDVTRDGKNREHSSSEVIGSVIDSCQSSASCVVTRDGKNREHSSCNVVGSVIDSCQSSVTRDPLKDTSNCTKDGHNREDSTNKVVSLKGGKVGTYAKKKDVEKKSKSRPEIKRITRGTAAITGKKRNGNPETESSGPPKLRQKRVNNVAKKPYKCCYCDRKFQGKSHFNYHTKTHTNTRPFQCSHCDEAFILKSCLRTHELVHTDEKPCKCSHCDEAFIFKRSLRTHQLVHTREKPYKCSHCDKAFFFKRALRTHQLVHTDEKPHKCSHCDKAFKWNSSLKLHLAVHTEEKPFKCTECDKVFMTNQGMKKHCLLVHTNKNPYQCSYCHKRFKNMHRFEVHRRSHTNQKPFKCSICGRSFLQNTSLLTQEKPYKCPHCETKKEDQIAHTSTKPYECPLIGKALTSKWKLTVHLRRFEAKKEIIMLDEL
ncbi:zinc finger protein 2 homolog [Actinia tenebrosa]|uniref:Zinc finger protein 2 homolog n=1 Tax=Actinia tenebrosa TaxID=6105 RepID=A0A6P8HYJ3_ACTTE|nr:zinc finger protein 2 homolog [Actinia tenebrosa]